MNKIRIIFITFLIFILLNAIIVFYGQLEQTLNLLILVLTQRSIQNR